MSGRRGTLIERFWPKIEVRGPDECWPWLAGTTRNGYGSIADDDGRITYAHRVAFALGVGPIPLGGHVLHSCDNPPCCNSRHLFLGDQATNMADMAAKGRAKARGQGVRGDAHWTRQRLGQPRPWARGVRR